MKFCINCGATPYYKKKGKKFCSIKCEEEHFNKKENKKTLELTLTLK